ncbi:sensor histidine kinase [Halalkalibacter urbisdiaboli]|uniref:sensor histidine kinase n=1 Tax=Halalkalibacter urbisdiaboli TaxID=1960589 RepID=UPI000B42E5F2|nr:sensor histidine kinase [Halalkalibacter urbisdiaboli]
MYKIKTKLMLFYVILFLILNSLSIFLFYNHKQTVQQYDHILNRFFLLNDVSQKSNESYESMNAYLNKKMIDDLEEYQNSRDQLFQLQEQLQYELKNQNNATLVTNYENMIQSLVDESDLAVSTFLNDDIELYSVKQREALKLLGFIQEETLILLNNELSEFQAFYDAMNKRNAYMESMGIAMFSGTFLMGLLFAFIFSNDITKPIHRLTGAAREIARGNLEGEDIQTPRKDELGFLTTTFNQMRTDLHYLVRQIKDKSEQEKLLKEMELKSLQSQINPHFLFNTLNTIAKTAYIEGSERIYQLITSISKLLRYNLSQIEKPVTLADEINIVKEYFFIQKARFEERVHFKIDVQEDCLSHRIPILTLQPLVENAFIHGIEPFEKEGEIAIEGFVNDGYVYLKIRDNGIGMDKEVSQVLTEHPSERMVKSSGHSTGLGMHNVIRRLQMFYQTDDILSIYSNKGQGTVIQLKLPIQGQEEGSDV